MHIYAFGGKPNFSDVTDSEVAIIHQIQKGSNCWPKKIIPGLYLIFSSEDGASIRKDIHKKNLSYMQSSNMSKSLNIIQLCK